MKSMEYGPSIEKKKEGIYVKKILQKIADLGKEFKKELLTLNRSDLDETLLGSYTRRSMVILGATWITLASLHAGKETINRVDYEITKEKYLDKAKENNKSFQELYKKAVELYGETYVNSLPGITLETGEALDDILRSAEEEKPEILSQDWILLDWKSFDLTLDNWDKKFREYEQEHANVLEEIKINYKNSSEYILFDQDSILDVHPGESFAVWSDRMDALGFDTLDVKGFITGMENHLPKGWVTDEIRSLTYSKDLKKIDHLGADFYSVGSVNENKEMSLYGIRSELLVVQTFAHEAAHENDWAHSTKLSSLERLEFLLKVYDRVVSSNRYKSGYVESILDKSLYPDVEDEKAIKEIAASEYWAEICEEYFSNGPDNLHVDDIAIIEWIIKKIDPDYLKKKSINGTYVMSAKDMSKLHDVKEYTPRPLTEAEILKMQYYDRYQFKKENGL